MGKALHCFIARDASAAGRLKQKPLLTPGEAKWMARADHRGMIDPYLTTGFIRAEFRRAMASLLTKGYVEPSAHSGYWQTDAGKSALISMSIASPASAEGRTE